MRVTQKISLKGNISIITSRRKEKKCIGVTLVQMQVRFLHSTKATVLWRHLTEVKGET